MPGPSASGLLDEGVSAAPPEPEFLDFEAEARPPAPPIEVVSRIPLEDVAPPAPPAAAAADSGAAATDLASPTLAELYLSQGHADKAIEVYRQILEREPGNARAHARLAQLEALGPARSAAPAPGGRRDAIQRTITRLEGMLAAVRRGY
jgi:hypothetical protein